VVVDVADRACLAEGLVAACNDARRGAAPMEMREGRRAMRTVEARSPRWPTRHGFDVRLAEKIRLEHMVAERERIYGGNE
jgi:hypothetical protein